MRQLPDADNITIAYPDEGAWKRFHYQFGDYPEVRLGVGGGGWGGAGGGAGDGGCACTGAGATGRAVPSSPHLPQQQTLPLASLTPLPHQL